MFDFDGDEFLFFAVAGVASVAWLIRFLDRILLRSIDTQLGFFAHLMQAIVPLGCLGFTYLVIQSFADAQVRGHPDYVLLFLLGQGLWFGLTSWAMGLLGLSIADDVWERANPAAQIVAMAGLIATSIIYAFSNIGAGPTIWTTIVPAAAATPALSVVWILIDTVGGTVLAVAVDVRPILTAIVGEAAMLAQLNLPADAAPAFLLDSNRSMSKATTYEGYFDNRSVSLPTDFPSANLLRSRGIRRAIVVQSTGHAPWPDLAHTLLRWRQAGIDVVVQPIAESGALQPATLRRPRWFRSIFHRFIATLGFRRSRLGGFGGTLYPGPAGG